MKKIFKLITILLFSVAFVFTINISISANEDNLVYLGGNNIGIKMNTGVIVIGKYEVETTNGKQAPWESSNIEIGDKIISVDNLRVNDNSALLNVLQNIKKNNVDLKIERNNQTFNTTISVLTTKSNQKSLGLYIKDKILGIGTMTFVDKKTNSFASLGHGVYQENRLHPTSSGVILNSTVDSIKKAIPGDAGEIRASINNKVIGYIKNNENSGLYGKVVGNDYANNQLIEVASIEEVSLGKAKIITTLENNKKKEYDIEIIALEKQKSKDIKGIKIKIIDQELLLKTGGIVQGMSGSPIIQNDKLIGAVSHVTVDNPTIGYGMYAKWMLQDARKTQ